MLCCLASCLLAVQCCLTALHFLHVCITTLGTYRQMHSLRHCKGQLDCQKGTAAYTAMTLQECCPAYIPVRGGERLFLGGGGGARGGGRGVGKSF